MTKQKVRFSEFLNKFPEVTPPVILGEDTSRTFSKENEPLPQQMINQYILPLEGDVMDEFTEFIPCFRLAKTYDIYAIVYWKASLMNYQYALVTFNKKGEFIDKKVIAGTFSDGQLLTESAATIDEDWTINIVSGQKAVDNTNFDATSSTAHQLELLPEGQIVTAE